LIYVEPTGFEPVTFCMPCGSAHTPKSPKGLENTGILARRTHFASPRKQSRSWPRERGMAGAKTATTGFALGRFSSVDHTDVRCAGRKAPSCDTTTRPRLPQRRSCACRGLSLGGRPCRGCIDAWIPVRRVGRRVCGVSSWACRRLRPVPATHRPRPGPVSPPRRQPRPGRRLGAGRPAQRLGVQRAHRWLVCCGPQHVGGAFFDNDYRLHTAATLTVANRPTHSALLASASRGSVSQGGHVCWSSADWRCCAYGGGNPRVLRAPQNARPVAGPSLRWPLRGREATAEATLGR